MRRARASSAELDRTYPSAALESRKLEPVAASRPFSGQRSRGLTDHHIQSRGGSALAVIQRGEVIVDVWEGWRDPARTTPWDAEALVNVYSVGKPVIALAVLMLVERGLIVLDDPMGRHWPMCWTRWVAISE